MSDFNFHRATNPHTQRPDHFAAALSKIGDKLVTDAMLAKRRESMDKKQDARTKLSNERTDARNLILDERSDKALELQAANRSEDMAYRDADRASTAQYRQDSLEQADKFNVTKRAGEARDATNKVTAAQIKSERSKRDKNLDISMKFIESYDKSRGGSEFNPGTPPTEGQKLDYEFHSNRVRNDGFYVKPEPSEDTPQPTMADIQAEQKNRSGAGQKNLLDPLPEQSLTANADKISAENKVTAEARRKEQAQPKIDRARISAEYAAKRDSEKSNMAYKGKLNRYLNTGTLLAEARSRGKKVVTEELESMWSAASKGDRVLIEAQLATLRNVNDIK